NLFSYYYLTPPTPCQSPALSSPRKSSPSPAGCLLLPSILFGFDFSLTYLVQKDFQKFNQIKISAYKKFLLRKKPRQMS
ncbi:MAG: hypothetical protein QHH74_04820, partial [Spirochaetota bacterium]|nr:hypothetical protein [Spirochaetota bacterium]